MSEVKEIEVVKVLGKVHSKEDLFLCKRIGDATGEADGLKLEMLVSQQMAPMIRHPDGRTWVLNWQDIVVMADAAFRADAL